MANDRAFTVATLAKHWRCRPSKVRALVRSGELMAFVLGERLRIPPAAVAAYEQRYAAAPAAKRQQRREPVVAGWVDRY